MSPAPPPQQLTLLRGADFVVTQGTNLGDGLREAEALCEGDRYMLPPEAVPVTLRVAPGPSQRCLRIEGGDGSGTGDEGKGEARLLWADSLLSFICENGSTVEAVALVQTTAGRRIEAHYLLPLAPIEPRRGYVLIAIDRSAPQRRLAQAACVSFARGTRITLADGAQKPIEALRSGERVLTRSNGPQRIRWIGRQVVRATGALAPVLIAPGALNNTGPLLLSANHRLFLWQRGPGAGRREVTVQAQHLVNGRSVRQVPGGFVEYFQLLFDRHEVIYAEGIATESQPGDPRLRLLGGLPASRQEQVAELRAALDLDAGATEGRVTESRATENDAGENEVGGSGPAGSGDAGTGAAGSGSTENGTAENGTAENEAAKNEAGGSGADTADLAALLRSLSSR